VLGRLASEPELDQLLAPALVYRLVTEIVRREGTAGIDAAWTGRAAGHRPGTGQARAVTKRPLPGPQVHFSRRRVMFGGAPIVV
jgi:hypothetical protein